MPSDSHENQSRVVRIGRKVLRFVQNGVNLTAKQA